MTNVNRGLLNSSYKDRIASKLPALRTTTIKPGSMLMYGYDAKLKAELPFWDKFPLIILTSATDTHFHGFNLHYMPFKLRLSFLNALYGADLGKQSQIIASGAVNQAMKWSIKQYIFSHVRTQFMQIPQDEWAIACFMPIARFTGASEQQVWRKGNL